MKRILLFPGGMKPFHDGHFSILNNYINSSCKIDEVNIIISKKDRSGITAESTLDFLNSIKQNLEIFFNTKFNISITEAPSPVMQCYRLVGNSNDEDVFCLVASSKDDDARVKNFNKDWSSDGKYYKGIDKIFTIDTNNSPILYNRDDEFNEYPISATIVRNDINNNNFSSFIQSYNLLLTKDIVNIDILNKYFNILHNQILIDAKDTKKLNSIKNKL